MAKMDLPGLNWTVSALGDGATFQSWIGRTSNALSLNYLRVEVTAGVLFVAGSFKDPHGRWTILVRGHKVDTLEPGAPFSTGDTGMDQVSTVYTRTLETAVAITDCAVLEMGERTAFCFTYFDGTETGVVPAELNVVIDENSHAVEVLDRPEGCEIIASRWGRATLEDRDVLLIDARDDEATERFVLVERRLGRDEWQEVREFQYVQREYRPSAAMITQIDARTFVVAARRGSSVFEPGAWRIQYFGVIAGQLESAILDHCGREALLAECGATVDGIVDDGEGSVVVGRTYGYRGSYVFLTRISAGERAEVLLRDPKSGLIPSDLVRLASGAFLFAGHDRRGAALVRVNATGESRELRLPITGYPFVQAPRLSTVDGRTFAVATAGNATTIFFEILDDGRAVAELGRIEHDRLGAALEIEALFAESHRQFLVAGLDPEGLDGYGQTVLRVDLEKKDIGVTRLIDQRVACGRERGLQMLRSAGNQALAIFVRDRDTIEIRNIATISPIPIASKTFGADYVPGDKNDEGLRKTLDLRLKDSRIDDGTIAMLVEVRSFRTSTYVLLRYILATDDWRWTRINSEGSECPERLMIVERQLSVLNVPKSLG